MEPKGIEVHGITDGFRNEGEGTMTETWLLLGYAVALLGQLSDTYTTERGLAHGLVEVNGAVKWIVSKIGNTGITLLKCVGLAQVFPAVVYIASKSVAYALLAFGAAAVIGWAAGITNYLQLRKAKVSLF
jgi:hypothetical protein